MNHSFKLAMIWQPQWTNLHNSRNKTIYTSAKTGYLQKVSDVDTNMNSRLLRVIHYTL